jgi:NTP pyrophosphatase (non-canonical NTP hydrolase)
MSVLPRNVGRLLTAALLISFALLPPVLRSVTRKPPNAEVAAELDAARNQAYELARDADDMTSLLHSDVSWQTHAEMLNRIRDHVNNMGKIVEKLESERDEASPWQQQAIDRMIPLLKEIASNTTAAIEHLNQNHVRPVSDDYKDYLQENADTAHELADMISSFVQYDRTRTKLEKLQDKIEAPTN